jgi:hypothetical protein
MWIIDQTHCDCPKVAQCMQTDGDVPADIAGWASLGGQNHKSGNMELSGKECCPVYFFYALMWGNSVS